MADHTGSESDRASEHFLNCSEHFLNCALGETSVGECESSLGAAAAAAAAASSSSSSSSRHSE